MEYWRFRGNVSLCNKQTTKRLVETRTRAHVCHVHTSAGIVQVAKNIKRRGGERASCFRAIKHFHFQFLVGAERRGAVGGQPVADDRWFVYRRSLCSSTLISHPPSLSLYLSLPLSLYLVSSTSSLTLWPGRFGLFVASIFFVVFHFEQPRFTPGPSTIPPFESPSRIERIPSNYLTLRTVASVCLSVEIRQNPAYRNASCTRWQFHRLSYYHWTVKANQARAK